MHNLSCNITLDHVTITSVHVSNCTDRDFNTVGSVVSKLWQNRRCVYTSHWKTTNCNLNWIIFVCVCVLFVPLCMCEMRNGYKLNISSFLLSLWHKNYEEIGCNWVAYTVQRGSRNHGRYWKKWLPKNIQVQQKCWKSTESVC